MRFSSNTESELKLPLSEVSVEHVFSVFTALDLDLARPKQVVRDDTYFDTENQFLFGNDRILRGRQKTDRKVRYCYKYRLPTKCDDIVSRREIFAAMTDTYLDAADPFMQKTPILSELVEMLRRESPETWEREIATLAPQVRIVNNRTVFLFRLPDREARGYFDWTGAMSLDQCVCEDVSQAGRKTEFAEIEVEFLDMSALIEGRPTFLDQLLDRFPAPVNNYSKYHRAVLNLRG